MYDLQGLDFAASSFLKAWLETTEKVFCFCNVIEMVCKDAFKQLDNAWRKTVWFVSDYVPADLASFKDWDDNSDTPDSWTVSM